MKYPLAPGVSPVLTATDLARYAEYRLGDSTLGLYPLSRQMKQIREVLEDRSGLISLGLIDHLAEEDPASRERAKDDPYGFFSPAHFIQLMRDIALPQELWPWRYMERFCERQVELIYLRYWADHLEDLLRAERGGNPVSKEELNLARRRLDFVAFTMRKKQEEGTLRVANLRLRQVPSPSPMIPKEKLRELRRGPHKV